MIVVPLKKGSAESDNKITSFMRLDPDLFVFMGTEPSPKTKQAITETGHGLIIDNQAYSDNLARAYHYLSTSPARFEYFRRLASKDPNAKFPRVSKHVKLDSRKMVGFSAIN